MSPTETSRNQIAKESSQSGPYTNAEVSEIVANYREAFDDFYGTPSRAPCIYKTGHVWPGSWEQLREMRPVPWPLTLDASSVPFSAIAGFGMANDGEAKAFCPLVINIGVLPRRIDFEKAKNVARHVKNVILCNAGFGHVDVAIREWRTIPLCGGRRKLDFLDPYGDDIAQFRHRFSSTPSLAIAPLTSPDAEGTTSLYFRLNSDSDDVFLLTAAHIVFAADQPSQDLGTHKVVNLGVKAFSKASEDISRFIRIFEQLAEENKNRSEELKHKIEAGDSSETLARRLHHSAQETKKNYRQAALLRELDSDITENDCSNVQNRVIGDVLHADPIAPGPSGGILDWAAVKLDRDKFEWSNFGGNKVYIGEERAIHEHFRSMNPNLSDIEGHHYPVDGLLEVTGAVPEQELSCPTSLNAHNDRGMPVFKSGTGTGTTFGWVNGLKTLVRYRIKDTFFDSRELTVIPYTNDDQSFSGPGDSGSAVLDRKGRVVGMITSGTEGVRTKVDLTYATPFHELESRIKEVFPESSLYPAVDGYY
ncbi:hypothetical protein BKA70DRAFT_1520761 [Coprinopsis sp. MPI-PUGE-AT-0042]|nr:hypothetical protein BKA70DRAFT_1520761 [Coprinopsis sp. MPI-PUGE-AT-0042]